MLKNSLTALLILLSVVSMKSHAANTMSGTITELWINDNSAHNVVFISTGQTYTSMCGTDPSRYFIIHLNEPSMKEIYAMALAAFMSGHPITMAGDPGNCYSRHEKIKYINMIKN